MRQVPCIRNAKKQVRNSDANTATRKTTAGQVDRRRKNNRNGFAWTRPNFWPSSPDLVAPLRCRQAWVPQCTCRSAGKRKDPTSARPNEIAHSPVILYCIARETNRSLTGVGAFRRAAKRALARPRSSFYSRVEPTEESGLSCTTRRKYCAHLSNPRPKRLIGKMEKYGGSKTELGGPALACVDANRKKHRNDLMHSVFPES